MNASNTALRDLSSSRCWELLCTEEVGRLAVAIADRPDIFPVNYRVMNEQIVLRTDDGALLRHALAAPAVAFEVDALDRASRTGWSIVVKGSIAEPQHIEDYLRARDSGVSPWPAGPKDRWLLITPSSVTGRLLPPATSRIVLRAGTGSIG